MPSRDAGRPNPFDNYYTQRYSQGTNPPIEPRTTIDTTGIGASQINPQLVDVDSLLEAEMLSELPELMKRIIDSSPFAQDTVQLSLRAQGLLEELRATNPINPFVFLHNNVKRFLKIRNGILLKLMPYKGYRLVFANGDRRFR